MRLGPARVWTGATLGPDASYATCRAPSLRSLGAGDAKPPGAWCATNPACAAGDDSDYAGDAADANAAANAGDGAVAVAAAHAQRQPERLLGARALGLLRRPAAADVSDAARRAAPRQLRDDPVLPGRSTLTPPMGVHAALEFYGSGKHIQNGQWEGAPFQTPNEYLR